VTGGVIAAAAVYQLTPLKQACLVTCRSPMMFLAERWRHGRAGVVELGIRHGAWCLACCWALMAALFAVGVMSVGWMAPIAVFIAGEKLLPWPAAARRIVAVLMLALGLGAAFVPAEVPGFAEPDGGNARRRQRRRHAENALSPATRRQTCRCGNRKGRPSGFW